MVRRVLPGLVIAVLAGVAAIAVLNLVSVERQLGPGRVEIRSRFSMHGKTELGFPPLGRIRAATHRAPLAVEARVEELDFARLQRLLAEKQPETAVRNEVEDGIEPLVRSYLLRVVLAAAVVGGLVGLVVPRRRWAYVLVGAVAGAATVVVVLGATWSGFEPRAFDEPEFTGALERAPEVIAAVERHVGDYSQIQDRVQVLGAQVARLYAVAASPPEPLEQDEVRILHVSDIHSNPLAFELVGDLADQFDVAAVLDTGDLTSFGYPIEAQVGRLIEQIDRPYLFVPGNHDSAANKRALAEVRNVQLLDRDVVDIEGLRILGVADPTFTADNKIKGKEEAEIKLAFAPQVARLTRELDPDVLAVHDHRIAADASGSVPLVLAGHTHKRSSSIEKGTRVLTVGSTGASGLGSFTVDAGGAYEAQVLHFVDGALRIVDYLSLRGLSGSYTIERRVVDPVPAEHGGRLTAGSSLRGGSASRVRGESEN